MGVKSGLLAVRGWLAKNKSNCFQEASGFVGGVGSPPEELVVTGTRIVAVISSHPVPGRLCRWLSNILWSAGRQVFALLLLSQGQIQSVGVQYCWSFYWRRSGGPGISNRAEAFPLQPGICSSLLANLLWVSFAIMCLQLCPKGKEIRCVPFMLFIVYKNKGGKKPLCFEFPSKQDFFGCLWIFLPCFVVLGNVIIHLSCFCCRTS